MNIIILFRCENNKLTTSVQRKPTFSGDFTNFKNFLHTIS